MQKESFGKLGARAAVSALPMAAALALGTISTPSGALGLSGPTTNVTPRVSTDPRILDLGAAALTDEKNITVTLAVRNQAGLDAFVASVADPKSANFRKFITPAQFAASYGQDPAAIAQVVSYLQSQGFTITTVHPNGLLVSAKGTNAQVAAAFGVTIHAYSLLGTSYQAPATKPVIPTALAGIATAITGLSTKASLRTHTAAIPNTGSLMGDVNTSAVVSPAPTGVPGSYSVIDLAAKYNVNPLYAKGLTGAGKTIGIATLAGYATNCDGVHITNPDAAGQVRAMTAALADAGLAANRHPLAGQVGDVAIDGALGGLQLERDGVGGHRPASPP